MQAVLQTPRLDLRPLTGQDGPLIIELNSHAAVMQFIEGRPHTEQEALQEFDKRLEAGTKIAGLGVWVGFVGQEFVGWWSIAPAEISHDQYDTTTGILGYRLLPKFWRQGLAKEGAKRILQHSFEDLGLQAVTAETMAINKASRATMESCGLQYVRTFYLDFDDPIPGTEEGEVEYKITREVWLSSSR